MSQTGGGWPFRVGENPFSLSYSGPDRTFYENSAMTDRNESNLSFDVEILEERQMLAGTVNVSVRGTDLIIVGDTSSNDIVISGALNVDSGSNTTTIVEADSYRNADRSKIKNIRVELASGDDRILVSSQSIVNAKGSLTIDGGDGRNTIRVINSAVKNLTITNGDAPITSFSAQFVEIINTQIGDDAKGTLVVRNGNGGSDVSLSNSFGNSVHGNVTIQNGDGRNKVELTSRIRKGIVKITNGDGQAEVKLENVDRIKNVIIKNGTKDGDPTEFHVVELKNANIEFGGVTIDSFGFATVAISDSEIKKNVKINQSISIKPIGTGIGSFDTSISGTVIEGGVTVKYTDTGEFGNAFQRNSRFSFNDTVVEKATKLTASKIGRSFLAVSNNSIFNSLTYDGGLLFDEVTLNNSTFSKVSISTSRGVSTTEIGGSDILGNLDILNADKAKLSDLFGPEDSGFERSFDSVIVDDSIVSRRFQVVHGSGGSETTIQRSTMGSFRFRANQGDDVLGINDATIRGNTDIRTGTSVKREISEIGGLDEDIVIIETDSSLNGATTFQGFVKIRTYGGSDIVALGTDSFSNIVRFQNRVSVDGGNTDNAGLNVGFQHDVLSIGDEVVLPASGISVKGFELEA